MTQIPTIEELALKINEVKQQNPGMPIMVISEKGIPCAFSLEQAYCVTDALGQPRIVYKTAHDRIKATVAYYTQLSAANEWDHFGPMEKAYYDNDFSAFEKSLSDTLAAFKRELSTIQNATPCFTVKIENLDGMAN